MTVCVVSVVGIGPHERRQSSAELRLLFVVEFFELGAEVASGPTIENEHGFAMQPIGRPIRRHVAAVSPDAADLHAAERLPNVLALRDLPGADHHRAVGRHHLVDDRRSFVVDSGADPAEHGERDDQHEGKGEPKLFHRSIPGGARKFAEGPTRNAPRRFARPFSAAWTTNVRPPIMDVNIHNLMHRDLRPKGSMGRLREAARGPAKSCLEIEPACWG